MQRFKRTPLIQGKWNGDLLRFILEKVNVKVGDLVVAEGTRGKYYEVTEVLYPEEQKKFEYPIALRLEKRFNSYLNKGMVKSRGRSFVSRTGWYSIINPISEEVRLQVAELCRD